MITIRRKQFTLYDETDNLKRMKDSDILAEKEKQVPYLSSPMRVAGATVGGAASGALLGAGVGTVGGLIVGKGGFRGRVASSYKGLKKVGMIGAALGGLYRGTQAYKNEEQRVNDYNQYNKRLSYAQTQARRREAKDWKKNMTQRDGYSY